MDNILWLEPTGDGGYVSDASRALDRAGREPCRMMLTGRGYDLAVTLYGLVVAELALDDDFVITGVSAGYASMHATEEEMNRLQQFIGRKVLYRSGKES